MKNLFLFLIVSLITTLLTGQNIVQIPEYTGSTTQSNYPISVDYGYTRTAIIYNKADIGVSGTINKLVLVATSPCTISIPIVIKLKEVNYSYWGGTTSYAAESSGATTVFSGTIQIASGYNEFILTTPFAYSNTEHLAIFTEVNYGGTGSTICDPAFVCKGIDSSTDWQSMEWHSDGSAPTNNGQLIDYQPLWLLYFEAPDVPQSFSIESQCDGNQLTWQKNAASDDVIIVKKAGSSPVNIPDLGQSYSIGDDLGSGCSVAYVGSTTSYLDTAVVSGTSYFYRIYSQDADSVYSETSILDSTDTPVETPYDVNFDGGSGLPLFWESNMTNTPGHGYTDHGLTYLFNETPVTVHAQTPNICGITSSSIVEFKYRCVNILNYPNNATQLIELGHLFVKVSTDGGSTYTTIKEIQPADHIPSTDFATVQNSLAAYDDQMINIKITYEGNMGNYYFDIDDFKVYDYVGIEENAANNLHIFPNPVDDYLNIENNDANISMVCIYDMNGKLLIEHKTDNSAIIHINIKQLASGMYMVKSMSETDLYQNLIIKN